MKSQSTGTLLRMYADILTELSRREVVRSTNNPVGDLGELLARQALDLVLVGKSKAGHDAVDKAGLRYQVKSRRITAHNDSRQLSCARKLETAPFDYLVGVLFEADFRVMRACVVPLEVVLRRSRFIAHVNGHKFLLTDDVWSEPTVRDLTLEITAAALVFGCT